MGNTNMDGMMPGPKPGEEPHGNTVAYNVFENIGVILKQ